MSRPERLGEAFCRLLERIPADRLPLTGGMSATVVVLLDYDQLLTGLGTATLDTGATHLRQPGPAAGLRGRPHPRRLAPGTRLPVGGAGPRPADPAAHRTPTHRTDHPRPRLHHPRLRPTRRLVPRPPRPTLVPRRTHQRRERPTALRLPPRQSPLTPLPDPTPPHRTDPVPPTHVDGNVNAMSRLASARDPRARTIASGAGQASYRPTSSAAWGLPM